MYKFEEKIPARSEKNKIVPDQNKARLTMKSLLSLLHPTALRHSDSNAQESKGQNTIAHRTAKL